MIATPAYPTKMDLLEAEQRMKWAWQYLMATDLHNHVPINNMSMAIQTMRKLRVELYGEPGE